MVLDCEKYMREALVLAREAAAQGEVTGRLRGASTNPAR